MAAKLGTATHFGGTDRLVATQAGTAYNQTISGGLTSTRSLYKCCPASHLRATYNSHATSSFSGERKSVASTSARISARISHPTTSARCIRPKASNSLNLGEEGRMPCAGGIGGAGSGLEFTWMILLCLRCGRTAATGP